MKFCRIYHKTGTIVESPQRMCRGKSLFARSFVDGNELHTWCCGSRVCAWFICMLSMNRVLTWTKCQ